MALLTFDLWQSPVRDRYDAALAWAARAVSLAVFIALLGHVRHRYEDLQVEQRQRCKEAETRARSEARERGEKLEAILTVARLVGKTPEPRRLLCSMLGRACAAVRATGGVLLLLSEDGRRLNQEAAVGVVLCRGKANGCQAAFARWVMGNAAALRIGDAAADPRFGSAARAGYRTVACVPLLVRGRPIGALQVFNKRERRRFTADDEALLCAFASLAALSIENAVLFEETKDLARRAVALAAPAEWTPASRPDSPARLRLV